MRAFVTGGAGFLGYHLIKRLVAQGWQVTVLDRLAPSQPGFTDLGVTFHQGSVTDKQRLYELLEPGTDAVFHIAGNTSLWSRNDRQQTVDNVKGTQNMLEAAQAKGARRFIHTSSFTVYGFHPEPFTERSASTVQQSGINYFVSKALAEAKVKTAAANGLDTVILNPANIMGPHDYRNWSQLFILIDREKLPGAPPGVGSFAYVEDVAAAHIDAFHKGRSGENYLLGGVDLAYLKLIREIGGLLDKRVPKRTTPGWLLSTLAKLQNRLSQLTNREPDVTPEKAKFFSGTLCCDDTKARHELGYQACGLDRMIQSTADWLRAEELISGKTD
ncbi:MAG: NAD-dependent epimerase/dehydratase family protein [Pseudomonadota bacterium]